MFGRDLPPDHKRQGHAKSNLAISLQDEQEEEEEEVIADVLQ